MTLVSLGFAIVLGSIALLLCVPCVVEIWLRLRLLWRTPRREHAEAAASVPKLLFLVPAHNEELLVAECVRSLRAMDYPANARRIVVIADNCTDGTARLAREAGAECLERHDTVHVGKPHALAWALDQLRPLAVHDACVVIDADTVVDRRFGRALAAQAPLRGKAVQAYFGTLNEWENWLTRLAGVLARGRYEVSYPLKRAAGLNCPLTGNGMCIGTDLLKRDGWWALSLTENWELYARYTAEGVPVDYAHGALLLSQEVRSLQQGSTQRQRWLAGRMSVLREWGGRILGSDRIGWLQKLDALVELGMLSPVLHLSAATLLVAAAVSTVETPLGWWIAGLALASLLPQALTTVVVVARHPQPGATIVAFARLPLYAVWRATVAVRTRGGTWRKTARHQPGLTVANQAVEAEGPDRRIRSATSAISDGS